MALLEHHCPTFDFFLIRITYESSVPEMRICSMLLIRSNLNGLYVLVEVSFYINLKDILISLATNSTTYWKT